MATFTTAQMKAAGIQPAAMDAASTPGNVMLEYVIDGSKKAIAAADIVTIHDIPTYAAFVVRGASIAVLVPGTATGTMDIGIAGTDITGLTAWATDAAAGTESVKLATAANSVITAGSASSLTLQQNTAGLGTGKLRVRIFGEYMDS